METPASIYARALFELALENKKSKAIYEDMMLIQDALVDNKDLLYFLNDLTIDKEDKKAALLNIFAKYVNQETMNFLQVVVDKARGGHLKRICDEYKKLYLKDNDIKEAIIYSAYQLADKEVTKIKNVLKKKYQTNFITKVIVDENIIGGIKIKIDDLIIDGSISSRIDRLKNSISLDK
jgi:F-type H+-transporting ATPase subunit delta